MKLGNNGPWSASRCGQSLPAADFEIWVGFGNRRNLRRQCCSRFSSDSQRSQPTVLHKGKTRRDGIEIEVKLYRTAKHVGDNGTCAPIRNVSHLRSGGNLKQLGGKMSDRAATE